MLRLIVLMNILVDTVTLFYSLMNIKLKSTELIRTNFHVPFDKSKAELKNLTDPNLLNGGYALLYM